VFAIGVGMTQGKLLEKYGIEEGKNEGSEG
jgi:hypothetical protein